MGVFLVLEASRPNGTTYRLGLGWIPELLDRIIGPSSFPWPLYDAFVSVLKDAGVAEAQRKVIVSDIPLRT
jgi:hypothetical protein